MIKGEKFVAEKGGVRLDAALVAKYPSVPRSFVKEACEAGGVLVNGRKVAKGFKLRAGDRIEIAFMDEECDNRPVPDISVPVDCVYEDDSFLAFDKPSGMPVQPLTRREGGTLMNGVVARWPECAGAGDIPLMAGALHRIDAGTSGLVLVARTPEAFEAIRSQFAAQTVKKTYLALVEGAVESEGVLENDLVHMPGLGYCKMVEVSKARLSESERRELAPKALHAVTAYRPVRRMRKECEELTLLEVTIYTGVTHQIRAQLALAGMHIVNDRLYGAFAVEDMTGHCLHSLSAEFIHPVTREHITVATPSPAFCR